MFIQKVCVLLILIQSYHIVQGSFSDLTETVFVQTNLQPPQYANVTGGQNIVVLVQENNVDLISGLLQESRVVNASIPFDGGTVHIIDQFLTLPQNISSTGVALNATSMVGALEALDMTILIGELKDVTLFVPSNAAFQRIGGSLSNLSNADLYDILSYHMISGRVVLLDSTQASDGSFGTFSEGELSTLAEHSSFTTVSTREC